MYYIVYFVEVRKVVGDLKGQLIHKLNSKLSSRKSFEEPCKTFK